MISLIPYIGGKHRIAGQIANYLRATGADCLVDVFGGSAAILLNSGFKKRVYNDNNGDLVNLFRVLACQEQRRRMLKILRWRPGARLIFTEDTERYVRNRFSFSYLADPVDRAVATFYRHHFAFGGKVRSGGFGVSTSDRHGIKELVRYRRILKRMAAIGDFFLNTLIEHKDYQDCISLYGQKLNCVLFVDPPYVGTENYYSSSFGRADHVFLSHQLASCKAKVVCTYYDHPLIRKLYPEKTWQYETIIATKNSQFCARNKVKIEELILVRKEVPIS